MYRIVIFFFLLVSTTTHSQRFGGTPPHTRWLQLSTDTARIIYPAGLDSVAQRVAALIHDQASRKMIPLGDRLQRIDIVLQNQTTIANGYVGLGPYRSEFYLTPGTNNFELGTLPWSDQLAIHEYRHVQQFNNFHNGLSSVMRTLFGEEGYALAINASIPDWFYEGDAVYNETILSLQGRGRLPLFMNAYPSLWLAKKDYSWMKLRNGSLKDYVPDHYNLGYLLVNYGREQYGLDFWEKVTKDASAFKGLFYPFQKAIKAHTGIDYQQFRRDAFAYYKSQLAKEDSRNSSEAGPAPVFPLNKRVVTNRVFPYRIATDSLIYLKTSYDHRPVFMLKDHSGEHRLRVRDISLDDQFSYRNGKIVYAAYETDPRWRWRDYSVVKLYDVQTGKQSTLTHRSKYFSPDISVKGDRIAVAQVAANGKSELHILDAKTGEVTNRIASGEIGLFTDPKFLNEDSVVTAVRLLDGTMALAIADLKNESIVRITQPSFNVVGYPCVSGNKIYFTGSYGGHDNLFVLNIGDQRIYQLTDWTLGNYFVNAANGKISWSAQTADGYQLQEIDESSLKLEPLSPLLSERLAVAYPVSHANEIDELLPDRVPQRKFASKKYGAGTRLFNFHSWRPYYEDPEYRFSVYGENVLNTLQTEIYYLYNENENTHAAGVSAVYGKWLPYISIGSQYTFNRRVPIQGKLKQWDQLDSRIGLSVPLTWTSGQTYKQLSFGSNYHYRSDFNKGFFKDSFGTVRFSYLQHSINWSQQVQMARQHLFPRWGYDVSVSHRHIIEKYTGWLFFANMNAYLPGAMPTHSIVLKGSFQQTDTTTGAFGSIFPYARGYNEAYFPYVAVSRMWRGSANYHLPLFYPDWGFANILYLQRVRGNAFFDFTRIYSLDRTASADQRSVGGELFVDTKWWNQYELSFGFRVSHLLDRDIITGKKGANIFEFILPVSILPK